MINTKSFVIALAYAIWWTTIPVNAEHLALHPHNHHYFLFRGMPTVLITSAEHYGAVLNLDFDYVKYLDTLAADGLNLTRVFSGTYIEPQGAFGIDANTLAPKTGRYIAPWLRNESSGKFDLEQWDPVFFERLKDFVAQAGKRAIVVELTLFCPMYEEAQWKLSPMNALNNVNGLGSIGRNDVHTRDKNGGLMAVQESLVRKFVAELRDADNVCYEICNEPYFGGVTMDWQHRIADTITDAEKEFSQKHLITQNIANGSKKIEKPHPAVSVFNFHYASPPDAVDLNYALDKVIGDNETGFKGTADDHYRMEAWEFILAGGGLYNNLDYSFTAGHEDGTFRYSSKQPGGGNPGFRKQMKLLKEFIHALDFVKMKPARRVISEPIPKNARCQVLAEQGRQYAAYFKGAPEFAFSIDLPAGNYQVQWIDVVTGRQFTPLKLAHDGGSARFQIPEKLGECAFTVVRDPKWLTESNR